MIQASQVFGLFYLELEVCWTDAKPVFCDSDRVD